MEMESFLRILYSFTNIPIYDIDENQRSSLFSSFSVPPKLNEIIKSNRTQIIRQLQAKNEIIRLKDLSNLAYVGFHHQGHKIVLGPFLEQETDLNNLTALKRRLRLIAEDAVQLDNMFHQLRVLSSVEIDMLYHMITELGGRTFDPIQYRVLTPIKVKSAKQIDLDSMFQEFEYVRRNYDIEDQFLQIVETGDINQANAFQYHEVMVNLPERAINDSLRNSKTRLTIFNTLCNRAAIRGGIDVQLGHQISTNFGIQIESMKSNFDSNKFLKDILVTYTEAVYQYGIKGYSKLIRNAIFYVRRHLTTNVSLQDIASFLYVSKEHLSRQFKHEVGMTITQYINHVKIVEAKKLLDQQAQTVLDISVMLGFANSSHFSRVFKQDTGMTPKQYQTRNT